MLIQDWVRLTFDYPEPKLFLEIGAHVGQDTAWMANIPGVTIHAFEPDPRNFSQHRPNVHLHRMAVADRCGEVPFILSECRGRFDYTKSSSINRPTGHLQARPDIVFGETIMVMATTLDAFAAEQGIERVDFIWADVQGAEREMIAGGEATLARTRYLYTEYSDVELYEGQPPLAEILTMLPAFRVLERWEFDVLLENTTWG